MINLETLEKKSLSHRLIAYLLSITGGLFVGVLIHYLLYRMSLPSHPFIYVAF